MSEANVLDDPNRRSTARRVPGEWDCEKTWLQIARPDPNLTNGEPKKWIETNRWLVNPVHPPSRKPDRLTYADILDHFEDAGPETGLQMALMTEVPVGSDQTATRYPNLNEVRGVEGLARIITGDTEIPILTPASFLLFLESHPQLRSILFKKTLEQTIAAARRIQDQQYFIRNRACKVTASVNLDVALFDDLTVDDLIRMAERQCESYRLSPEQVAFEIFEKSKKGKVRNFFGDLLRLGKAGFSLRLDDFVPTSLQGNDRATGNNSGWIAEQMRGQFKALKVDGWVTHTIANTEPEEEQLDLLQECFTAAKAAGASEIIFEGPAYQAQLKILNDLLTHRRFNQTRFQLLFEGCAPA